MASRNLALLVVAGRGVAMILYVISWSSVTATPDHGFSALSFLRVILPLQLLVSMPRFLHDLALVLKGAAALPPNPVVAQILSLTDLAFHYLTFAAAVSSLNVVDLVARSLNLCDKFTGHACGWYTSAGIFCLFGWLVSVPVTRYTLAPAEYAA